MDDMVPQTTMKALTGKADGRMELVASKCGIDEVEGGLQAAWAGPIGASGCC